jgi:hypothetical protein
MDHERWRCTVDGNFIGEGWIKIPWARESSRIQHDCWTAALRHSLEHSTRIKNYLDEKQSDIHMTIQIIPCYSVFWISTYCRGKYGFLSSCCSPRRKFLKVSNIISCGIWIYVYVVLRDSLQCKRKNALSLRLCIHLWTIVTAQTFGKLYFNCDIQDSQQSVKHLKMAYKGRNM